MSKLSAPDPGQIVLVRNRPFVVLAPEPGISEPASLVRPADLVNPAGSVNPPGLKSPAGLSGRAVSSGSKADEPRAQLLQLSSMEEDSLGETISVIWDLEPGARIIDKSELPGVDAPEDFDTPSRLDAFLDAVRWGAVSSVDQQRLQSPFRSGIEIEEYQLEPVIRSLGMPRVSQLIADDVGLGKTIEAGLVIQELILRHRARTVLVVCPSSLQIQWKEQMLDKFGLEFRIIDSDYLRELRRRRGLHVNPWNHFPRLITSIDFIKRDRPSQLLGEVLAQASSSGYPRSFDILVVDEAHNVAPATAGGSFYARDSDRTQLIRRLVPHCEHKLFLSATPHNGYRESFTALLELLDNQRFARNVEPRPEQVQAVMTRRLKSELLEWDSTPRFAARRIIPLPVNYAEDERLLHRELAEYTRLRLQSAGKSDIATSFVLKMLKKRLFSSTAAFASTLEQHRKSLGKAATTKTDAPARSRFLAQRLAEVDEEHVDERDFIELEDEVLSQASITQLSPSEQEAQLLDSMSRRSQGARQRPDAKASFLLDWLDKQLRPGDKWNAQRVLIFTEYRTTLNYLQSLLAARGFDRDGRLKVIHGETDMDERDEIKKAFQTDPAESAVRILLATDAASEGIDLQNHCHLLVHYEIPWNPNRLEQRNGRLDRHGQKAPEVLVHHFVGSSFDEQRDLSGLAASDLDGDLEFLMRAVLKINNIREDLGSVGPVIASQIEAAMLGRGRASDIGTLEKETRRGKGQLKSLKTTREDLARYRERLETSRRELHVDPDSVRRVVSVALEMNGKPPLIETQVKAADGSSFPAWHLPSLGGDWLRCAEGLKHPYSGKLRPVVFDEAKARRRDDVVLAHLNHRLVKYSMLQLRSQIWGASDKRLHRVAARLIPSHIDSRPAVLGFARLVVLGADNHRLHEEIIAAGGFIVDGKLERMNQGDVERILSSATDHDAPLAFKERLVKLWPQLEKPTRAALEAREKELVKSLTKKMSDTCFAEIAKIEAVLKELAEGIERTLSEKPPPQLELFSELESKQFESDREALRHRLAAIPGEIEIESDRILRRYAEPKAWLFPFALCFYVPEGLAASTGGQP